MSISDLGLNLMSALGFPTSGSPLCWIQGVFATFFTLSGWFWTTILAYRVYSMVRYGGCKLRLWQMHTLAWGLPVLLTALPLSTTNYGSTAGSEQWCLFLQRGNNPHWLMAFWSYSTFLIWLIICIILMLAWQCIILYKFRDSAMKAVIRRTYDKVYLYPLAMIVCWTLNVVCDDVYDSSITLNALSMMFAISNGIISAVIFMIKSEEARRRWSAYLFPQRDRAESDFNQVVEPDIRLDFEQDDDELPPSEYGGTDYTGTSIVTRTSAMSERDESMVTHNPIGNADL